MSCACTLPSIIGFSYYCAVHLVKNVDNACIHDDSNAAGGQTSVTIMYTDSAVTSWVRSIWSIVAVIPLADGGTVSWLS